MYFIEAVGFDLVKVGKTTRIERRLPELQIGSPAPLRLIKVVAGYSHEETTLHRRWAEHRSHGEWFRYGPIRNEIEALERIDATILCACGKVLPIKALSGYQIARRVGAPMCKRCKMVSIASLGGKAVQPFISAKDRAARSAKAAMRTAKPCGKCGAKVRKRNHHTDLCADCWKPRESASRVCTSCNGPITGFPRLGLCQPCYMRAWAIKRVPVGCIDCGSRVLAISKSGFLCQTCGKHRHEVAAAESRARCG